LGPRTGSRTNAAAAIGITARRSHAIGRAHAGAVTIAGFAGGTGALAGAAATVGIAASSAGTVGHASLAVAKDANFERRAVAAVAGVDALAVDAE